LVIALQPAEQFQSVGDHLFHRLVRFAKELIRDEVVRFRRKRGLQSPASRQAQFGADMNDGHAGLDRASEVIVVGSRTAMQGQRHARRCLDLRPPPPNPLIPLRGSF